MKLAFVGVKRKYRELATDYWWLFDKHHLELPTAFAEYGRNEVVLTTVDEGTLERKFDGGGSIRHVMEVDWPSLWVPDVVVHWRRWYENLYRPSAINLLLCQDHSFSVDWQFASRRAFNEGKLHGILCFPTWHKRNLLTECPWLPAERAFDGVTLGVDTDVYRPYDGKNPYEMIWASDPGRGLDHALLLAIELFRLDRRFKLHVCWPDYVTVSHSAILHPAIVMHRNVKNGPELWDLFNRCGVVPYTSVFMEPSSRTHRQGQAAGCLVLYPPNKGSPSELIRNGVDGIVSDPSGWAQTIKDMVESGRWKEVGVEARKLAEAESWKVQAERFNALCKRLLESK